MEQILPFDRRTPALTEAPKRPNEPRRTGGRTARSHFERRRYLRWPVFWPATIAADGRSRDCLVLDFSPGGAKVRANRPPALEAPVSLTFPCSTQFDGRIVWSHGGVMGIEFREGLGQSAKAVADVELKRAATG